ncbi:hybrid sensor histidine kinase/response regulator [Halalkalibacterium halodurans]|uniref:hybrid sensor histidine kinase/response regulator n=1 Tax=Halalkalibacterium halodurans TaxID=86665 RepID=UPI002E1BDC29
MKVSLKKKAMLIVSLTLFISILTCARIVWISTFISSEQPYVVGGELDLRGLELSTEQTITLDGEWAFYPSTWLIDKNNLNNVSPPNALSIEVPGGWKHVLSPEKEVPYGYGSYQLKIFVDPEDNMTYSIRVPSVRSASALYVDGRLIAGSGQLGESEADYVASNLPYTASFTPNGSGVIEVVIQAANFKDTRNGGIIRSIKFGPENAIARETQLSMGMQQMAAVVFFMHGIYALILFLIGSRERRLLYFSLLTFSAMLLLLLGSEEKLLSFWFPQISYDFGFKLVHLCIIGVAFSLLRCVAHELSLFWYQWFRRFSILCGITALLTLVLPVHTLITIQPLHSLLFGTSVVVMVITMFKASMKKVGDNFLLLLSLIALTSNFCWWGFFVVTGIKVLFYPFDLIISTTCFAAVWFRRYFAIQRKTDKLVDQLKRANKTKDDFLANTSHELRNPLHSILNLSEGILEREKRSLNEKSVADLKIVLSVGRRMSFMLNDLLDAMSLKENTPRLMLQHLSIHTIANGVLEMFRFMVEGKPIRLNNQIPENIPNVLADESRVIQILFNLVHNAVKFTREGEISLEAYVKDDRVYIAIRDTGIGMDKDALKRVFDPYEQVRSEETMVEGGFGLGLSISQKLVELHGGILTVRSTPGQGSVFTFSLQISKQTGLADDNHLLVQSDRENELAAATLSKPTISPVAYRPRILVVDDEPVNLKVIASILANEAYEVKTVISGEEAIAVLDTKEWDLVVADVMMPKMSGYELTKNIRQRFTLTELPILLITARSRPEDIENGFRAGANDYLTKPVNLLELRARIKALTEAKQSIRDQLRMEGAWLQAQIQPHFLFNTLNAILALSEIDIKRMQKLLEVFADFLKNKFTFTNLDELAPIEIELSTVQSYLYIEKERFAQRLNVRWEVEDCKALMIPLFTIQPLVENAVKHGLNRSSGGEITIKIKNEDTYVKVTVTDNGVGMDENIVQHLLTERPSARSGIGLRNTDMRLKRHYGKGLHIESKLGVGTSVSFLVQKQMVQADV